jgi:magnesium transporter
MIHSVYRAPGEQTRFDLKPEEIGAALQQPGGLLWVDLAGESAEDSRSLLRETFGFHPLAVDDALDEVHVPKVDDWGEYLYLVLHAVIFEPEADEPLHTHELDLFLGKNYLVTYRSESIPAVDRAWAACQRDERHLQKGAGRLLYKLTDELVADYMPAVEAMDEAIDEVEDGVFGQPGPTLLARIFTLKRALLHLRRIIAPQREVLNKLARGDFEVLDEGERIFSRDVYDHLVRLYDITEGLRDLVGGALDTYLSVVSNRMNEVMRTLTVITTLFMPVSFLVGFFGTNFFQPVVPLAAWTGRTAFGLMLLAMVVLPAGMFLWMRKRAWM